MTPNRIKRIWESGRPVINGWLCIPSTVSAEVMACQGWDSLTVDLQHGVIGYQTAVTMIQAIETTAVTPIVRVPWLDAGMIMKVLDAGAYGVICPMINNRDDAERFVSYVRYPPIGVRSFGPRRAIYSYGPNYTAEANQQIICLAMIETGAGLENVAEIAATPHLDGLYIGPSDLSLALGHGAVFDSNQPDLTSAFERILETAHQQGIIAGIHTMSPEFAAHAIDSGFNLVTISDDARILASNASAIIAAIDSKKN